MKSDPTLLTRRMALGAGALLAAPLVAKAAAPARAEPQPLTVATTEGPYYFDAKRERSDIREGRDGVPLELQFTVVDAAGAPLRDLRVDVWHCDARGRYSGFAGQGEGEKESLVGETFLRGHQRTAADGQVVFRTIYPGWYAGRTTHIHLKVIAGAQAVLTTQFFLPDALSEFLYTQLPAYRRAMLRDTLNSADGIALEAGNSVKGAVREQGDRYVASLALVVDPAARPVAERPPMPPPGRGASGAMPPPPGMNGRPGGPPPRTQALQGEARVAALVPQAQR